MRISLEDKKNKTLKALNNLNNLPSIPEVMYDVIKLIKSEPGNVYKLSHTIAKDQGMTTRILSVANSPLYGIPRTVSTVEFAIMILGINELQNIVTAISLSDAMKMKSTPHFNYLNYWKHSMMVGLASKDIARRLNMPDIAGDAFVGGMLHDLGIQVIVKYFPQEFKEIVNQVESGISFFNAEKEVLGLTHQETGKFLAQKWGLPQNLCDAIEFHHNPSTATENSNLASIIHLADSMTQEFRIGDIKWDANLSFDISVGSDLGFESTEALGKFTEDYRDIFTDTAESIVM
jgi:putative nucleotidyltransferase with HDIG domain